jgi:hypothetical protein
VGIVSRILGGGAKVPPDRTAELLGRHLTGDFTVFPMAETRCTVADVEAVGRAVGIAVPPEVVAHVTGRFPGVYVEAKEEVWPRPEAYAVGPFWSFLYAVHTYTPSAHSEDWMRMDAAARQLKADAGLTALPVLRVVGDANLYCVDAGGGMVRFDHELGVLEPVEGGFFDLLDRELAHLRERTERKKRGEDGPTSGGGG